MTTLKLKTYWLTAGLLIIITVCWGQAGYIYAKAQLAQYLISDAWQQSIISGMPVRPWDWADTYPVAKLSINQAQPLYVLAGASNRNLAFGPVLLNADLDDIDYGNADNADKAQAFNISIAAHRDTHFALLQDIEYGDSISLDTGKESVNFVVDEMVIVDEKYLSVLDVNDKQVITLITCYPFDALSSATPLRYVVRGRLVEKSVG
ncbi:MAG: class GN sortase [Glaciecola sp.]|jgi:sortase A|nr:class GN sortase [Glaciecola sp.]